MEPKSELLVFNKKEVAVVIVLLVLVAMFSFTLGLKLGKALGTSAVSQSEAPPLTEKKEIIPEGHGHLEEDTALSEEKHAAAPAVPADAAKSAEDHADAELVAEADKAKAGLPKPVPLTLPKEKTNAAAVAGARFTLQVGSYRTVAEAAEQVSALKRQDLDAFYLEKAIPGKGTWYRVGIGLFPSKEAAEKAAESWKPEKSLPPFLIQKISE